MTALADAYTATVGGESLPVQGGELVLDAGRWPHVQGELRIPLRSEEVMAALDVRASPPPRVIVQAFRDGMLARTFDLSVRQRSVRRSSSELTLPVASDEALLDDYAPLSDDVAPFDLAGSIREVCDYVLGVAIPGASLAAVPATDADVTPYWRLDNLVTNPKLGIGATGWISEVSVGSATAARVTRQTVPGTNVTTAYRVTAGAGATGWLQARTPPVRTSPGAWATVSGMYFAAAANRSVLAGVDWYDANGVRIGSSLGEATIVAAATGHRPVAVVQAPDGAQTYRPFVRVTNGVASGSWFQVTAMMATAGKWVQPYHDGDTAETALYSYEWTDAPNASTAVRIPKIAAPDPDAFIWKAGMSAMDFLHPLLQAQGLRLVCDESRTWTIRNAAYLAAGQLALREGVDLIEAEDTISRDAGLWFDARVTRYRWTDASGVQREVIDAWALTTPHTLLNVLDMEAAYPGPGRSEYAVRRAQNRGREVTATTPARWDTAAEQPSTIVLLNAPLQYGQLSSVRFDLDRDEMTVTVTTTEIPSGSWLAETSTETWLTETATTTWLTA